MSNTLTVSEKYSRHWPLIAIVSAVLALSFYISYHLAADVLLEGYLRLVAFGFFALAVLSFFKVKDGRIEITIEKSDELIEIYYRVRDKIIHEEELNLADIRDLKMDQMPNKSLYNDLIQSDRCIRFRRTDSDGWLYLHEIYGRVIPLSEKNASEILQFIEPNSDL